MQMTLPMIPMVFILSLKKKTERMIMVTCFTFPTTFIINGPPCFTALKLATFKKNASMPWRSRSSRAFVEALGVKEALKRYDPSHFVQKRESL